jgi:von Willebrand factor type A domain/Aerotolerance regulator N-terminal
MNWLPNFLNWQTAGLATLLAIPPLVLLYFLQLRRTESPISSTILWKKSVQDLQVNSPFQKLRRNLLLLLQLLILAALLFSLARPVSFQKAQPGSRTIILIDRSGSMNANDGAPEGASARTRLDEAKRQARELVDAMPSGGRAALIAFDTAAQTLVPFSANRQQLKNAIDSIMPTDRSTRLKLAYQLADAAMNIDPSQLNNADQLSEVFVYSDGRVLDAEELSLRGAVRYVKLGRDSTKNIAIVSLSARRNYDRPTEVQVFARLANFGPEPVDTQVQLAISPVDAADADTRDVFEGRQVQGATRLLPVRWNDEQRKKYLDDGGQLGRDSVEFNLELTTGAIIQLTQLNAEGDAMTSDDVARVVVPPPKRLAVAMVGEGNFFLEKVIDSLGLEKPTFLTPDEYDAQVT